MCDSCGCSQTDEHITYTKLDNHGKHHDHHHDHPHTYQQRTVEVKKDILSKNDSLAQEIRQYFKSNCILALNLVSSPGSGKTTILEKTITALQKELSLAVIEGDQQTLHDAQRIEAAGAPAIQVNTGSGCHLDADMIHRALEKLSPHKNSLLFIENVGNLVCPALFDLGEAHKIAIISVTEGEDKPLKYPTMFQAADICLINKVDLLPYVDFDVNRCIENAKKVNNRLTFFELSAKSCQGMDLWFDWLRRRLNEIQVS